MANRKIFEQQQCGSTKSEQVDHPPRFYCNFRRWLIPTYGDIRACARGRGGNTGRVINHPILWQRAESRPDFPNERCFLSASCWRKTRPLRVESKKAKTTDPWYVYNLARLRSFLVHCLDYNFHRIILACPIPLTTMMEVWNFWIVIILELSFYVRLNKC